VIQAKVAIINNTDVTDFIISQVSKLDGQSVKIGIHPEDASTPYERGGTLGSIAKKNEFGSGNIPERSFERSTFDAKNKVWFSKIRRHLNSSSLRGAFDEEVVRMAGAVARDDIKHKIRRMKRPRNAQRTIQRKGFDNPLMETGKLYRSIKYKMHRERISGSI